MIERLVVRGDEGRDRRADAVFERRAALPQRLEQRGAPEARNPLVPMGMTRDFMAGGMDSPDLRRVMEGTRALERSCAHHREAGGHLVLGVQLEIEHPEIKSSILKALGNLQPAS